MLSAGSVGEALVRAWTALGGARRGGAGARARRALGCPGGAVWTRPQGEGKREGGREGGGRTSSVDVSVAARAGL